jgi:sigma-B regulation protein RsbU (phosphoserine phosphatase)
VHAQWRRFVAWLGRVGFAFAAFTLAYIVTQFFAPGGSISIITGILGIVTGVWLAVRLLRLAARHAVWRLRNRLIVTYLFIAVVPILLIATLAAIGAYGLLSQITVYLVTEQLDRKIDALRSAADSVMKVPLEARPTLTSELWRVNVDQYPGLEILLRQPTSLLREPRGGNEPAPHKGWKPAAGVVVRENLPYLWAYSTDGMSDIVISSPMTPDWLAGLAPSLGPVALAQSGAGGLLKSLSTRSKDRNRIGGTAVTVPPPIGRFDYGITWFAQIGTLDWDHPNQPAADVILAVFSRISAVVGAVFNRTNDAGQTFIKAILVIFAIVFLIVEVIAAVIGVGMTRTITSAVHRLYEGTQKIREGDFSHRIEVSGRDQLGELGHSFNQMTGNLERLVVVAKEKERLQSEIEIARDVQNRLFPRSVPQLSTLRLQAVCHPARMVSGDYYGFDLMQGSQVAVAIADVAGKGISAALLMAALQSSLRSQLEDSIEAAAAAGNGAAKQTVSTSRLVSRLNRQLHASTSPEKYATFCLGVYDDASSMFTYTNAGHLPPLLVRNGSVDRLDVNGTVVGAFSFAKFTESKVQLQSGDLLVCFTDGITEPENEYGEMFGEERLMDLVARNAHRSEAEIIDIVVETVRQFARAGEAQDDMTILLARRV